MRKKALFGPNFYKSLDADKLVYLFIFCCINNPDTLTNV